MKTGNGFNKNVERTLPLSTSIKVENNDLSGLRFSVIKAVNQADVMITVDVLEPEHLRTIKLNLFREDQPGVVLQSLKLDNSPLVILPVLPMDDRKYFIQLESNLGRHNYAYQIPELLILPFSTFLSTSIRGGRRSIPPKQLKCPSEASWWLCLLAWPSTIANHSARFSIEL